MYSTTTTKKDHLHTQLIIHVYTRLGIQLSLAIINLLYVCLSGLWLGGLLHLSFLSDFLKLVCYAYVFPCNGQSCTRYMYAHTKHGQLTLQNIEADSAEFVDVRMVYFGQEAHFRRSHGILFRKEEL